MNCTSAKDARLKNVSYIISSYTVKEILGHEGIIIVFTDNTYIYYVVEYRCFSYYPQEAPPLSSECLKRLEAFLEGNNE